MTGHRSWRKKPEWEGAGNFSRSATIGGQVTDSEWDEERNDAGLLKNSLYPSLLSLPQCHRYEQRDRETQSVWHNL
jgi:hypothetical protein